MAPDDRKVVADLVAKTGLLVERLVHICALGVAPDTYLRLDLESLSDAIAGLAVMLQDRELHEWLTRQAPRKSHPSRRAGVPDLPIKRFDLEGRPIEALAAAAGSRPAWRR
jgi:hypothetical protein